MESATATQFRARCDRNRSLAQGETSAASQFIRAAAALHSPTIQILGVYTRALVVAPEYRPNWGRRTSEARARRRSTPTVVVNGPASHDGLVTPREILATSERSVAAK